MLAAKFHINILYLSKLSFLTLFRKAGLFHPSFCLYVYVYFKFKPSAEKKREEKINNIYAIKGDDCMQTGLDDFVMHGNVQLVSITRPKLHC